MEGSSRGVFTHRRVKPSFTSMKSETSANSKRQKVLARTLGSNRRRPTSSKQGRVKASEGHVEESTRKEAEAHVVRRLFKPDLGQRVMNQSIKSL